MFSVLLLCSLAFAESKTLALQIALDRAGFSCNIIDGCWGAKSERALSGYLGQKDKKPALPCTPEQAYDRYFKGTDGLFRTETVTQDDLSRIAVLPTSPAEKANLSRMGYESIKEMFAERGHLSQRALERLNPGVNWNRVAVGTQLVIPNFPPIREELAVWPKDRPNAPKRPEAAKVIVSLSNFEVCVYGKDGSLLALFPCSIAKSKAKLPPVGELKVLNAIARPNYTYTPDFTPKGEKPKRYVWPEGENCPIGVAWLGLNLPGYGMHGTPKPETIGNAESHGCFRLANWNAARLYALCPPGTPVIIRP